MHIPDGLLAPQTYLPAYALVVPLWWWAGRRVAARIGDEVLPRLAVLTALALVLSTVLVPLPGGTSAHLLGVSLLALCFGPLTAFLAYSAVLAVQAVMLGAGGITTLGLNALCLGLVGAGLTVLVRRLFGRLPDTLAVPLAVWLAIMTSALLIALALGLQAVLATDDQGRPLFFPFSWSLVLPAVLLPYAVLGAAEGVLTLLVWRHARRRGWVTGAGG